jgi:hypothetical protein
MCASFKRTDKRPVPAGYLMPSFSDRPAMSPKTTSSARVGRQAAVVTVNFSDAIQLRKQQVEWTPHGVSLITKWPFSVGAEVEFAFEHEGARHCCVGVVVACRPLPRREGLFSTVLYFIEVPCNELRHAACDCRLAHPKHRPPSS